MSDDLRTLLDEWKAMADAATPGPWEADGGGEIGQHWSLPEPWEEIVSTDVTCMSCCYGGSSAGVEREEDAAFIAASRTVVPRLIAAVEAVLKVHRPGGVYDKCECVDPDPDDGVHIEVEEVGITCNCIYEVCRECCTGDEYLTESCTDYHDHKPGDKHLCPTTAALRTALIGDDDE